MSRSRWSKGGYSFLRKLNRGLRKVLGKNRRAELRDQLKKAPEQAPSFERRWERWDKWWWD